MHIINVCKCIIIFECVRVGVCIGGARMWELVYARVLRTVAHFYIIIDLCIVILCYEHNGQLVD